MENKDLICPICGEPTYLVYGKNPRKDRLCKEHSQQLFNKEIYFDENKNLYFDTKTKKPLNKIEESQEKQTDKTNKTTFRNTYNRKN